MADGGGNPGPDGWVDKAQGDLAVARLIITSDVAVDWAACFHAQQAAEKALKAVLVHLAIDFPKAHDLDRIIMLMPADIASRFDLDALIRLTPWSVAGRYPEDIGGPRDGEAEELIERAAAIVGVAVEVIGAAGA